MKKSWLWLSLVAALLVPHVTLAQVGYPQQCTNSTTNPTSAEWLTCTQARAGTTAGNPIYTSPVGGVGGAGAQTQWYTGAAWSNWAGGTLTDNFTQPTMPYNAAFQMVWDGAKWDRMTQPSGGTTGNAGDAISATQAGVYSLSLGTFYNSTSAKFQRWTGAGVGADGASNTTPSPWMSGWLYGYNGATWDRLRTGAGAKGTGVLRVNLATDDSAVTYLNTLQGTVTTSRIAVNPISGQSGVQAGEGAISALTQRFTLATDDDAVGYLNTLQGTVTTSRIATNPISGQAGVQAGEGAISALTQRVTIATDDDAVGHLNNIKTAVEIIDNSIGTPASASPTGVTMAGFHDGTNAVRLAGLSAGADAITNSTPAPWIANFNYGFNGSTWDRLYVLGTQADAQATTVNGLVTSSFLYGYNGSTFDMLRIGASNELQVTDVAVRPGENAGLNVVDTQKVYSKAYTPAKTATATIADGAGTTVLAAVQIISYPNCTITAKNTHGSVHWTGFEVWTGPTATGPWTSQTTTACDALVDGTGAECWTVHGHSFNYVYAVAVAASASSASDVYLTCNAN